MVKVASHPSRIWLDEYALSGYLTASELSVEQETVKVDTFSDAGPRRVVGNYDTKGSHMGLFDAAAGEFDQQAFSNFRTDEDHYLAQWFGGAAEGSVGFERIVRLKSTPRKAAVGQAVLLNIEEEGAGPIVRSTLLRSAAITGTGNGTGRNLGATTSGQIFQVVYRILAVSGTGSIVLQCHESSDDGGGDAYASISDLASGTLSAIGVTRKTTTAATEAYKRVTVATFSGFTSVTVLVTAGLVPNT